MASSPVAAVDLRNAFELGLEMYTFQAALKTESLAEHGGESARRLAVLCNVLGVNFTPAFPPDEAGREAQWEQQFGAAQVARSTADFLRRRFDGKTASAFTLGFLLPSLGPAGSEYNDRPEIANAIASAANDVGFPRDLLAAYLRNPSGPLLLELKEAIGQPSPSTGQVFIVHGRNHDVRDRIDLFLRDLGLRTRVMAAEPHRGLSLPEKFEQIASECSFAVFILTADDVLADPSTAQTIRRARQNVVLEIGYFWGRLGRRSRVAFLVEDAAGMELPSDIQGLGWIPITSDLAATKIGLRAELEAAELI